MEEEGIRLALTMVTWLVKKNYNKIVTILIQGDGKTRLLCSNNAVNCAALSPPVSVFAGV